MGDDAALANGFDHSLIPTPDRGSSSRPSPEQRVPFLPPDNPVDRKEKHHNGQLIFMMQNRPLQDSKDEESRRSWQRKAEQRTHRNLLKSPLFLITSLIVVILGIIFLLLLLVSTEGSCHRDSHPWTHYRLPRGLRPTHYDIHLSIDVDNPEFYGNTTIFVHVETSASIILLHGASKMQIKSASLRGTAAIIDSIERLSKHEYIILKLDSCLREDSDFILDIAYSSVTQYHGERNADRQWWVEKVGLFANPYDDSLETSQLTTQFQFGFARHVFPCFDEPSFKATFRFSVTHSDDVRAISNFLVESREHVSPEGREVTTEFVTSMLMSTYLTGITLLPREAQPAVNRTTSQGVLVRIWSFGLARARHTGEMLFNLTEFTIEYCETMFNHSIGISKLDFVHTAHAGAGMENWGMVTINNGFTGRLTDEYPEPGVALLQTYVHEIVHHWLGNMITCDWWSGMWINEGITMYLEYEITNLYFRQNAMPDWEEKLFTSRFGQLMSLDKRFPDEHIHMFYARRWNMYREVPFGESGHLFDDAFPFQLYNIGSLIARQLNSYMGNDLNRCIGFILDSHMYGVISMSQFLTYLDECPRLNSSDPVPPSAALSPWLFSDAVPILKVTQTQPLAVSYDYFCLDRRSCPRDDTYFLSFDITDGNATHTSLNYLMHNGQAAIFTQVHIDESSPYFVNSNLTGKFIVQYPHSRYETFLQHLESSEGEFISSDVFANGYFLADLLTLSKNGYIPYSYFVRVMLHFSKMPDLYVQMMIFSNLGMDYAVHQDYFISKFWEKAAVEIIESQPWERSNKNIHVLMMLEAMAVSACGGSAPAAPPTIAPAESAQQYCFNNPFIAELDQSSRVSRQNSTFQFSIRAMNDSRSIVSLAENVIILLRDHKQTESAAQMNQLDSELQILTSTFVAFGWTHVMEAFDEIFELALTHLSRYYVTMFVGENMRITETVLHIFDEILPKLQPFSDEEKEYFHHYLRQFIFDESRCERWDEAWGASNLETVDGSYCNNDFARWHKTHAQPFSQAIRHHCTLIGMSNCSDFS